MRPNHQLKVRVYAAGLLHSAGFQDEKSWKQIKISGELKTVPYTSRDIARDLDDAMERYFKESGVRLTKEEFKAARVERQNVRRALAWLEESGLAERRLKDGTPIRTLPLETRRDLNHGDIHLYFFCKPNAASERQARRVWQLLKVGSQGSQNVDTCDRLKSISYAFPVLKKPIFAYLLKRLEANLEVVNMDYLSRELKVVVDDYQKDHLVVDEDYQKRFEVVMERSHIERKEEKVTRESKDGSSSSSFEGKKPTTTKQQTPSELLRKQLPPLLAGKGALTKKQSSEVAAVIAAVPEPELAVRYYLDTFLPQKLPNLRGIGGVLKATIEEFPEVWRTELSLRQQAAEAEATKIERQAALEERRRQQNEERERWKQEVDERVQALMEDERKELTAAARKKAKTEGHAERMNAAQLNDLHAQYLWIAVSETMPFEKWKRRRE